MKFLLSLILLIAAPTFANNASYLAVSNLLLRNDQMQIVSNNIANSNTDGFVSDKLLITKLDVQDKNKENSYVEGHSTYNSDDQGPLITTHRTLDIAIAERNAFFRVITPRGNRYTLNGNMFISNEGILVNAQGYPYHSFDGDVIVIPIEVSNLQISGGGLIFADGEEIGNIGVFTFPANQKLSKDGNALYKTEGEEIAMENFTILNGTLRGSNVNPAVAMTEMIELQRSHAMATSVIKDVYELQTKAIKFGSK